MRRRVIRPGLLMDPDVRGEADALCWYEEPRPASKLVINMKIAKGFGT